MKVQQLKTQSKTHHSEDKLMALVDCIILDLLYPLVIKIFTIDLN